MPCHGCATNFSLFVKEHTCANCKFSFCTKCLKRKVSTDEASQRICNNCLKMLTSKISTSIHHVDPPGLQLKYLETLENPTKPPITIFKQKGKLQNLKVGLGPKDKQLVERLEKLKEDHKITSPPSESELKHRLMILKGFTDDSFNDEPHTIQPQFKSEQEEVDDLLKQYINEMTLEGKIFEEVNESLEDIKKKVQKLHVTEIPEMQEPSGSGSQANDGDFISKRIIEKAIAEAKLEKILEKSPVMCENDYDDDYDHEEEEDGVNFEQTTLPWCIICNEDASLKCIGCDGSLYCNTCFKQGHEFFEMGNHKTINFK